MTTGTIYTDKLFTGQREMTGLGIYHYGARFYSQKLGRFISPDTIVQNFANPQFLNRFSYTINNPLRYTDPTGHVTACNPNDGDVCKHPKPTPPPPPPNPIPQPDPDPDPTPDPNPTGYVQPPVCTSLMCNPNLTPSFTSTPTVVLTPTLNATPTDALNCNMQEAGTGAVLIVVVDTTTVGIPVAILFFVAPEAIVPYLEATEPIYIPANVGGAAMIIDSGCFGEEK